METMNKPVKVRINCITLPVEDIQRSFHFYSKGLGLGADDPAPDADHVAFELSGGIYLVIILRKEFGTFTEMAGHTHTASHSSECILSYFASGKEEVDAVLGTAEAAGGIKAGPAKEHPWGYAGYFKDPDGHVWEVMWNPGLQGED